MAGRTQATLGADQHVDAGQDRIERQALRLLLERGAIGTADGKVLSLRTSAANNHQVTPVFDQLIKQLAELLALLDWHGEQLQRLLGVLLQDGGGDGCDALFVSRSQQL